MNLQSFYSEMSVHQKKAIDATIGQLKGQIIMPTGSGKTWVQVYKIIETLQTKQTGISLIAAHRLLLCEQLIENLLKRAIEFDLKFDVLTVGSEGVDDDDVIKLVEDCRDFSKKCNISRTTTSADIEKAVEKAKKLNRHLLIVSTYQSISRLSKTQIDIACFDEAHEVTKNDKHESVEQILPNCNQTYFFTATAVHGCNTRGMDNKEFYGEVLAQISPRHAIDTGDILPPIVHRVILESGKHTDHNIIKCSFMEHKKKVQKYSKGKIGAKLLVSCTGVSDMLDLVQNEQFNSWSKALEYTVIAFSSRGYFINGKSCERMKAIKTLQALSDKTNAIIMHYDILTEGIDLPNITAILPLRELNKVKFLQTAGRAARIQKDDRATIKANKNLRTKINKNNKIVVSRALLKPVFWIIQNPLLNEKALDTNESLIECIRNTYEVTPEFREGPTISTSSQFEEAESVLDPETPDHAERNAQFAHLFEDIIRLKSMSSLQRISYYKKHKVLASIIN
jgi:superfamily II DNA or RNA helicase